MHKILWLFLFLAACQAVDEEWVEIKYVIDGDTVIVEDGTAKGEKIRLIGINAPEPRDYKHRKAEPFGKESSAYLKKVLQNQSVRLEFDIESQDQYGRTLAYIFLKDGTHVNELMVAEGYAEVMTFPPNVKYVSAFMKAQQSARRDSRGIWQ